MRTFKRRPGVRKGYREQLLVWALCQNRDAQEVEAPVREKVARLLQEAGGEYAKALEAYLCTGASWEWVVAHHHLSERTLQRCVCRFLAAW